MPLLEVDRLSAEFHTRAGVVHAVNDVSFSLDRGEKLAVVGESGSGKTVLSLSLMRLVREPPAVTRGRILLDGTDVRSLGYSALRRVRGRRIAMVFQDPMSSLNPVRTIGAQLVEPLRLHLRLGARQARERAAELLQLVGIPMPRRHLGAYPHQLSGGMRQRVAIAMALSCEPEILIADEPTTALDVSIQAQVLDLLRTVTGDLGTALVLVSHDLSVVAGIADRVAVMYAGEIVELGVSEDVFADPRHPYTLSLLRCVPRLDEDAVETLPSIEGSPPDPRARLAGSQFAPRCPYALDRCWRERPTLEEKTGGHYAACWVDLSDATPGDSLTHLGER